MSDENLEEAMGAVPATVAGVKAILTKVRELAPSAKLVVVGGGCSRLFPLSSLTLSFVSPRVALPCSVFVFRLEACVALVTLRV